MFRGGFDGTLGDHPLETLLATAAALTVGAIVAEIVGLPGKPYEVIVSGGGIKNQFVMRTLASTLEANLPQCRLLPTDELGIASASKEALAFAMLGAATLDGTAANVMSATGARRAVVLGS